MKGSDSAMAELAERFGRRFGTGDSLRAQHGRDESGLDPALPAGVVFPESTAEVSEIVRICGRHGVPVIPYGAASGHEGGVLAIHGGVCVDMTRLNQIIEISPEDMTCVVEAGVTRLQLERALRSTGLMFTVDPGADATIGGMAATRAAGTTTPLYGNMQANVMGLEVVLANGEVIRTGGAARKSSSGYDLTRLMVGSEGTLGLITSLRLRLHPVPEAIVALRATFPDLACAVAAVVEVVQFGLPVARAELVDAVTMRGLNLRFRTRHPEQPTLLFEFHGGANTVDAAIATASDIVREHAAGHIEDARSTEDRNALWKMRHAAAEADQALRPGCRSIVTDVAVPVSRLAELLAEARERLDGLGIIAPLVGHMADGNFHFGLLVGDDCAREQAAARAFKEWLARRALELGGTISGEHGIGIGKMELMAEEHGGALDVMRRIKRALDPAALLNPGKLVPGAER